MCIRDRSWTFEEVDAKLKNIMANIFKAAHETAEEFGVPGNYVLGGNIAGFRKVDVYKRQSPYRRQISSTTGRHSASAASSLSARAVTRTNISFSFA